jgi:hypothetical protein
MLPVGVNTEEGCAVQCLCVLCRDSWSVSVATSDLARQRCFWLPWDNCTSLQARSRETALAPMSARRPGYWTRLWEITSFLEKVLTLRGESSGCELSPLLAWFVFYLPSLIIYWMNISHADEWTGGMIKWTRWCDLLSADIVIEVWWAVLLDQPYLITIIFWSLHLHCVSTSSCHQKVTALHFLYLPTAKECNMQKQI